MKITKEILQILFDACSSYKEILDQLDMNASSGGGYRTLKKYICQYDIDLTLFKKNKKFKQLTQIKSIHPKKYDKDNVFVLSDTHVSSVILKKIIFDNNILSKNCSECGIGELYNNKPLTLQLDHIDGNSKNNQIPNLRILCPNCHTQTDTYGSKNRKNKKLKRTRTQYNNIKHKLNLEKYAEKIKLIEVSDIDFSKWGWTKHVAKIIQKHPQKVAKWMRTYMPEFYSNKCYKRKSSE